MNWQFYGKIALLRKVSKIIVYITSSQLKSLEQMQKFFIGNVHIIPTKLVINTYSENSKLAELTEADMLTLEQVLANQTIHLGGSYKNIQNEWVYVNGEQIVSAIKNLPLMEGDVSILFHPRTFMDCKQNGAFDLQKVAARISLISNAIKLHYPIVADIYSYIPNFILENFDEPYKIDNNTNIRPAPKYECILFVINNPNLLRSDLKEQFISVDQYNAFANIKVPVYPFMLNTEDQEQMSYLTQYKELISKGYPLGSRFIIDNMVKIITEK